MQSTPRERLTHYADLLQGTLFNIIGGPKRGHLGRKRGC